MKYVNQTVDSLQKRLASSEDQDFSILEELLLRGMPPNDVITMVIDLLMAGIDTVNWRKLNREIHLEN